MAFTLSYPRCYAANSRFSPSYACGGPHKQFQHFVKFTSEGETEEITGWKGNTPTTGYWQGPPNPDWEPKTTPTPSQDTTIAPAGDKPSFLQLVKQFFDTSQQATKAATVAGYTAIALVGAGLLVWYIPRKK